MSELISFVNQLIEDAPDYSHLWNNFHPTSGNSLEDRWEAFCLAVNNNLLYGVDAYSDGNLGMVESISGTELTMYDDFNIDRGQTISFPFLGNRLKDLATPESYDKWREHVLTQQFTHFRFDW